MANCPACQTALLSNKVDEFSVRLCPPCKGLLLPHVDAVKILDRSWRAVKAEDAEKMEFRVSPDAGSSKTVACPDCRHTMEQYGYMGLKAIMIDRCDQCSLLWLDADELQNMVLALAKTNYRSDKARLKEWRSTTDGLFSAAIAGMAAPGANSWLFHVERNYRPEMVVAKVILGLLKL